MNLHEQIEKAFKAGFECALDNTEWDDNNQRIETFWSFSLDKAVTQYINKMEPIEEPWERGLEEEIASGGSY